MGGRLGTTSPNEMKCRREVLLCDLPLPALPLIDVDSSAATPLPALPFAKSHKTDARKTKSTSNQRKSILEENVSILPHLFLLRPSPPVVHTFPCPPPPSHLLFPFVLPPSPLLTLCWYCALQPHNFNRPLPYYNAKSYVYTTHLDIR